MPLTRKMRAIGQALDRSLGITWERERLARAKNTPACVVRLDRLEVTASGFSPEMIVGIPGFRRTSDGWVRRRRPDAFLPYGRIGIFEGIQSIQKIIVCYQPTMRRLARCKVTLIARDSSGLKWSDVSPVLEILPDARLTMVELAFDFGFASGVDGAFVRAHAVFGKARRNQVAARRGWDTWGARKGVKFVRSYYK